MNDLTILKKKLSTFRSDKNKIRNVPPEVLAELLRTWESWPGTSKEFYAGIGVSRRQMAGVLGKAKRLKREGHFPAEEFQEIQLDGVSGAGGGLAGNPCNGIELLWGQGKVIRFPSVEPLLEFLKKVA